MCQDLGDHWDVESEQEERILEVLSLGNCAKSSQGGEGVRVRSSISFFKKKFFLMCTILKVFIEFVTILLLFY